MLARIRAFFDRQLNVASVDDDSGQRRIEVAAAALLIELTKSDETDDPAEWHAMLHALRASLGLSESVLSEIVALAEEEVDDATDLFQFTQLINFGYSYQQKLNLIESMWRVAFADGRVDKYEEYLIRKVAGLLHVGHSDYIRFKQAARTGDS